MPTLIVSCTLSIECAVQVSTFWLQCSAELIAVRSPLMWIKRQTKLFLKSCLPGIHGIPKSMKYTKLTNFLGVYRVYQSIPKSLRYTVYFGILPDSRMFLPPLVAQPRELSLSQTSPPERYALYLFYLGNYSDLDLDYSCGQSNTTISNAKRTARGILFFCW